MKHRTFYVNVYQDRHGETWPSSKAYTTRRYARIARVNTAKRTQTPHAVYLVRVVLREPIHATHEGWTWL